MQKEKLRMDPDKMRPVQEYPSLQNLKQLRRFMGMASWYRSFIPQFATVATPLIALTRKNARWQWTTERQKAFEVIKERLTTVP